VQLGAGRRTTDDDIDHAVGIVCRKKRGDSVAVGEVLAVVHARHEEAAAACASDVLEAYEVAAEAPGRRPVVLDYVS
jgi:thymidine phosphorylase